MPAHGLDKEQFPFRGAWTRECLRNVPSCCALQHSCGRSCAVPAGSAIAVRHGHDHSPFGSPGGAGAQLSPIGASHHFKPSARIWSSSGCGNGVTSRPTAPQAPLVLPLPRIVPRPPCQQAAAGTTRRFRLPFSQLGHLLEELLALSPKFFAIEPLHRTHQRHAIAHEQIQYPVMVPIGGPDPRGWSRSYIILIRRESLLAIQAHHASERAYHPRGHMRQGVPRKRTYETETGRATRSVPSENVVIHPYWHDPLDRSPRPKKLVRHVDALRTLIGKSDST